MVDTFNRLHVTMDFFCLVMYDFGITNPPYRLTLRFVAHQSGRQQQLIAQTAASVPGV